MVCEGRSSHDCRVCAQRIDLIPDVIPVLGYLDEVILLPIAIALVIRMIPEPLTAEFREDAQRRSDRPTGPNMMLPCASAAA